MANLVGVSNPADVDFQGLNELSTVLTDLWKSCATAPAFDPGGACELPVENRKIYRLLITRMATPWIRHSRSGMSRYFGFSGCRKMVFPYIRYRFRVLPSPST